LQRLALQSSEWRISIGGIVAVPVLPAGSKTQALTGQNEAAKTDLKSPGPGALDAFRGIS
jgi:hypothetical protein